MDEIKVQAMLQELHAGRTLVGNSLGDRCAVLAGELAAANQRIETLIKQAEDAQAKVVELTEELEKLKPRRNK